LCEGPKPPAHAILSGPHLNGALTKAESKKQHLRPVDLQPVSAEPKYQHRL